MALFDFDKEFSDFMKSDGKSVISEIHNIIPTLSPEQQMIIGTLSYYAKKYDLEEVYDYLKSYMEMTNKNKNLNFVRSFNFKNLLKAYTQEELIRGIKVNANPNNDRE